MPVWYRQIKWQLPKFEIILTKKLKITSKIRYNIDHKNDKNTALYRPKTLRII